MCTVACGPRRCAGKDVCWSFNRQLQLQTHLLEVQQASICVPVLHT